MGEALVSDDEYPTYYVKLEGMRETVAAELVDIAGDVLDIATGSAYFAIAQAGNTQTQVTLKAWTQIRLSLFISCLWVLHF